VVKVSIPRSLSPLSSHPNRSQYKRFQDLGMDNKVPGPGKYFDTNTEEQNEQMRDSLNHRTVGRIFRKPLGKQNEKPKIAVHTFGADVHRFKHSFLGRLDLAAEAPGTSLDLASSSFLSSSFLS
jgi:hypothetical protein